MGVISDHEAIVRDSGHATCSGSMPVDQKALEVLYKAIEHAAVPLAADLQHGGKRS